MKILHISTGDAIYGAMIGAHRLSTAMNHSGISSKMLVREKNSNDNDVTAIYRPKATELLHQIKAYWEWFFTTRVLKAFGTYTADMAGLKCNSTEISVADIIYIHWVENSFLNTKEIVRILKCGKPTFFFLRDMGHFTGGCHYSLGCHGYQKDCSHCPVIERKIANHFSERTLRRKINSLRQFENFQAIAPSQWLAECAKKSTLFHNIRVSVIPNTLDTSEFKIINKADARKILNLPLTKRLILFGAVDGNKSPYKGWKFLVEALERINTKNTELVIFGGYLPEEEKNNFIQNIHQVGIINDQYSLMLIYNACDVFVIPSIAENLPQTVIESISCGTPVVGFNVGGIPELVHTGKTGYLAKYKDTYDLAAGIDYILQGTGPYGIISRESLHSFAEENFSEKVVVEKHRALWAQIGATDNE